MARGPDRMSKTFHVPATITATAANIPFWWNNTDYDWSLDSGAPPTVTMGQSYTGSGSASDGTKWLKTSLLRVDGSATETGLCDHVLTTGNDLTAQVGDEFDKMTGSSYVIPSGTGVNLDFTFGAGAVNLTISAYSMVTANFLRGEVDDQS